MFSKYHATDRDAREYQVKVTLFTLSIFCCYAAYIIGVINVWWMAVLTSVMVTRWMIAFHELLHMRKADELDLLTRLLPIPFAPFNIGYREYRSIHAGHHRHVATDDDPDAFHIQGGHLKALLSAITLHEQQLIRYVSIHGMSHELAIMIIIRLTVFTAMLTLSPSAFLYWWLALRITYIINDFVFFHLVHYRAGKYGTFPIPLHALIRYPLLAIYGIDVVYATMHHDVHHEHPLIAAKYLPRIAQKRSTGL